MPKRIELEKENKPTKKAATAPEGLSDLRLRPRTAIMVAMSAAKTNRASSGIILSQLLKGSAYSLSVLVPRCRDEAPLSITCGLDPYLCECMMLATAGYGCTEERELTTLGLQKQPGIILL